MRVSANRILARTRPAPARRRAHLVASALLIFATWSAPGLSESTTPSAGENEVVTLLLGLLEQHPGHEALLYPLARQMDDQGRVDEALAWLDRLAATGWDGTLKPADFPRLREDPRFLPLVRGFDNRARKVRRAEIAHELHLADLRPEGSAWDPSRREILLSSGRQRKVVGVGPSGRVRDIVQGGQHELLATLGMEVDDRGRLWIASTAAPFMEGFEPSMEGDAAVFCLSLPDGDLIGRWDAPDHPALLNDLTISSDGRVFVTDTLNGKVWRLEPEEDRWIRLAEGFDLVGPNGIAWAGEPSRLVVADLLGLVGIDPQSGATDRLTEAFDAPRLGGIDGLDTIDPRQLVAIQNVPGRARVWRLVLDDGATSVSEAELLEAGNETFRNPTTGAIAEGELFFVANPDQGHESDTGAPEPSTPLRLLRLPLAEDREEAALRSLRKASATYWGLWRPPEAVDLERVLAFQGDAAGFGLREWHRMEDDPAAWRERITRWLSTIETLDYRPLGSSFKVDGDLGLEWGTYVDRQVKRDGRTTRDLTARYSLTWSKRSGIWRVVAFHRSLAPEP